MSSTPEDKSPGRKLARRQFLTVLASIPLAACSSDDSTEYQAIGDAVKSELGLKPQPSISLQEAASVPYSSIGFRIGNGRETLLVLAESLGNELLWTASSRVSLLTRNGRLLRSSGFDWNLAGTKFLDPDPVISGIQRGVSQQAASTRFMDFQDIGRYGVLVRSRFGNSAPATIEILGHPLKTMVATEDCDCDSLDWKFQNTFWADAETGFVWKSVQSIHPNLDPLTVEILRPPS
jgi:hypothetical protein